VENIIKEMKNMEERWIKRGRQGEGKQCLDSFKYFCRCNLILINSNRDLRSVPIPTAILRDTLNSLAILTPKALDIEQY